MQPSHIGFNSSIPNSDRALRKQIQIAPQDTYSFLCGKGFLEPSAVLIVVFKAAFLQHPVDAFATQPALRRDLEIPVVDG